MQCLTVLTTASESRIALSIHGSAAQVEQRCARIRDYWERLGSSLVAGSLQYEDQPVATLPAWWDEIIAAAHRGLGI
jgi:hypothetical protein